MFLYPSPECGGGEAALTAIPPAPIVPPSTPMAPIAPLLAQAPLPAGWTEYMHEKMVRVGSGPSVCKESARNCPVRNGKYMWKRRWERTTLQSMYCSM